MNVPHEYRSYADGEHFKENRLLSGDEFTIALILYLDDFEIANPLGTSKQKHKMCAVYWVIANIPVKYRSTLNSTQVALLCNTSTMKQYGYEKVLQPLILDLISLEQHGVYVEQLGANVKGTVLFVAADNLAAHSLAGFYESFTVEVCMASRSDTQQQESTEPTAVRCLVLRGLPVIFGDDASMFFKSSSDEVSLDIPVGILCFEDNRAASPASPQLNPSRVGIILEGSLVMDKLTSLPQAMCPLVPIMGPLHAHSYWHEKQGTCGAQVGQSSSPTLLSVGSPPSAHTFGLSHWGPTRNTKGHVCWEAASDTFILWNSAATLVLLHHTIAHVLCIYCSVYLLSCIHLTLLCICTLCSFAYCSVLHHGPDETFISMYKSYIEE
ncbi:uncharacterized protein LOC113541109 [Pangasianodon hypophthalmus]|uniref:uncharacterized protein LOC113541109 n=1 Tax=Pangasianodon hypophthalmus TaxID=310915 RepID=UPI002306F55B|nr:uncharacterized protein LOC113541109 [Pangasianodon hypophthalmus]